MLPYINNYALSPSFFSNQKETKHKSLTTNSNLLTEDKQYQQLNIG